MKKSVLSIVLTVVMLFSLTATVWGSAWPVVDRGYCGVAADEGRNTGVLRRGLYGGLFL